MNELTSSETAAEGFWINESSKTAPRSRTPYSAVESHRSRPPLRAPFNTALSCLSPAKARGECGFGLRRLTLPNESKVGGGVMELCFGENFDFYGVSGEGRYSQRDVSGLLKRSNHIHLCRCTARLHGSILAFFPYMLVYA